jgi:CHRD domain
MRGFAVALCGSAAFLSVFSNAGSAQEVNSEELLGGRENPPVISEGSSGTFSAPLDDADPIPFTLTYELGPEVGPADVAHLHIANPGNNGGIVVFLCSNLNDTPPGAQVRPCPPSGEVTGDILATDVLAVAEGEPPAAIIEAGDLAGLKLLMQQGSVYANVHTPQHPNGEIRGQLLSPSLAPARRR